MSMKMEDYEHLVGKEIEWRYESAHRKATVASIDPDCGFTIVDADNKAWRLTCLIHPSILSAKHGKEALEQPLDALCVLHKLLFSSAVMAIESGVYDVETVEARAFKEAVHLNLRASECVSRVHGGVPADNCAFS